MSVSIRKVSDGQPPTRDARGLVVEAEDEWVIEGDPSDVEDVKAGLSPTVHRRVGPALLVQFVNVVGVMDLPHLGRLHVRSRKWDERDFERMLEDISREVGRLPFAAGTGAHLPHDRTLATPEPVLYHRFVYLQHILNPASPSAAQVVPAIRRILADPHRRLQSMRRTSPLELARRVDERTLVDLASGRGDWRPAGLGVGNGLSRRLNGKLPVTVSERHVISIVDVPENRFVRTFLDVCLGIVEAMESVAASRSGTGASGWFRDRTLVGCGAMRRHLAPLRAHRLWDEVGRMDRLPIESTVLQRRYGYRDILRHYVRLRLAPRIPFSDGVLHGLLDLKNIAELYELWCFFQVVQAVTGVVGSPTTAALPERTVAGALDERLDRGLEVAWDGGVRVSYNSTFAQGKQDQRSYSVPLRPDVSLFIPEGPASGYHLFDAKFRLDRLVTRDAGASLVDDEDQEREGAFKRADLYKMHTYREAIARARSVRILYPGTEEHFFCAGEGASGPEVDGVGAVPVVPGATSPGLVAVIERLLSGLGGDVSRRRRPNATPSTWA